MATSEEPGAKTGGWEQKQGTAPVPCTHHLLRHPSSLTPEHILTLTPYKEPVQPALGSKQGNVLFVLDPSAAAGILKKPFPNFLFSLWSISVDKGDQEPWSITSLPHGSLPRTQSISLVHSRVSPLSPVSLCPSPLDKVYRHFVSPLARWYIVFLSASLSGSSKPSA